MILGLRAIPAEVLLHVREQALELCLMEVVQYLGDKGEQLLASGEGVLATSNDIPCSRIAPDPASANPSTPASAVLVTSRCTATSRACSALS